MHRSFLIAITEASTPRLRSMRDQCRRWLDDPKNDDSEHRHHVLAVFSEADHLVSLREYAGARWAA